MPNNSSIKSPLNIALFLTLILSYFPAVWGGAAPLWYNNQPGGYVAASGVAQSPEAARGKAWANIFSQIANSKTSRISGEFSSLSQRLNETKVEEIRNAITAEGTFSLNGKRLFNVIASQQDKNPLHSKYTQYLLVCLSDCDCACRLEYPSNTSAALRSTFIPGSGQIYKGRIRRGMGFLSATSISIAGGLISVGISQGYYDKASDTRTTAAHSYYRNRGNTLYWSGIAALAIGLGVHIWNIFDAGSCEGVPEFK